MKPTWILSLDGGGVRGLILLQILKYIEAALRKRITELFDVVAGTSTGGIIALGLTMENPKSALEMETFYLEKLRGIFGQTLGHEIETLDGFVGPKYRYDALLRAVRGVFGNTRVPSKAIIPTFNMTRFQPDVASPDWLCVDAAMATSAGPTIFAPHELNGSAYIDGGTWCNNPTMEAVTRCPGDKKVLSLGTGVPAEGWSPAEVRGWNELELLPRLIDVFTDGVAQGVHTQCESLLPWRNYLRIQTTLKNASMDDVSPDNFANLILVGERLVKENKDALDAFISDLAA